MRSKRKQRRQQVSKPLTTTPDLPDPFSALNPEVEVEEENQQYHQDACPCCIDMMHQRELNRLEKEYLDWTKED